MAYSNRKGFDLERISITCSYLGTQLGCCIKTIYNLIQRLKGFDLIKTCQRSFYEKMKGRFYSGLEITINAELLQLPEPSKNNPYIPIKKTIFAGEMVDKIKKVVDKEVEKLFEPYKTAEEYFRKSAPDSY